MKNERGTKEEKFNKEFMNCKGLSITQNSEKIFVKKYREFLEVFEIRTCNYSIDELEDYLIGFVKLVGALMDIEINVYNESEKIEKIKNTRNNKFIYLDDLQSIIDIIVELGIARVVVIDK